MECIAHHATYELCIDDEIELKGGVVSNQHSDLSLTDRKKGKYLRCHRSFPLLIFTVKRLKPAYSVITASPRTVIT